MGTISKEQLVKDAVKRLKDLYGLTDKEVLSSFVKEFISSGETEDPEESFRNFIMSPSQGVEDISGREEERDEE